MFAVVANGVQSTFDQLSVGMLVLLEFRIGNSEPGLNIMILQEDTSFTYLSANEKITLFKVFQSIFVKYMQFPLVDKIR